MATEEEITEVTEAMSTAAVDMILIAHSDGRVTCRTHHSPQVTGNWLITLGQTMLGEGATWPVAAPDEDETDLEENSLETTSSR